MVNTIVLMRLQTSISIAPDNKHFNGHSLKVNASLVSIIHLIILDLADFDNQMSL